jgi:hypothetical protein
MSKENTVTINGLTAEQAKILAEWFCNIGEQQAAECFEIRDVEEVITKNMIIKENGDVEIETK